MYAGPNQFLRARCGHGPPLAGDYRAIGLKLTLDSISQTAGDMDEASSTSARVDSPAPQDTRQALTQLAPTAGS